MAASIPGFRTFDSLRVGETVYSLGAPEGHENTFAPGVVSSKREQFLVQTSAPISQGSSGGGLFDVQGNLVGITTLFHRRGQALNFAIRADAFWETDRNKSKAGSSKAAH